MKTILKIALGIFLGFFALCLVLDDDFLEDEPESGYFDDNDDEVKAEAGPLYDNVETDTSPTTSEETATACTLWAILVSDTEDENIGEDNQIDNRALNKELTGIAQSLGLELKIKNITGNAAYDKRNLTKAIKAVKAQKNDVVFFCFNGHGFRWDNQRDKYPNILMMGPDDEAEGHYVLTTDIYNALLKCNARLTICLTDCCNAKIGEYAPRQQDNTLYSRDNARVSKERMQDLLLHTQGSILATAANPGEYAWSFGGSGSAFTQSFIAQWRKEVSSNNTEPASWETLMDNTIRVARQKTEDCENVQNGMRNIKIRKTKSI